MGNSSKHGVGKNEIINKHALFFPIDLSAENNIQWTI